MQAKKIIYRFILYFLVAIILIWCIFPFYWAIISSLKPDKDLFEVYPSLFPKRITFENYIKVFTERPFHINILNSVIVAGVTTLASLLIGSLAAYAIA
ncbi:MAG: trehalose/maltose transport system permease protein, partial [Thermosipho sp. (in: thermotogales)]|nr:trehalose/maltose transport system permease protein [Thermosipho sp. (in: thermotogales)]